MNPVAGVRYELVRASVTDGVAMYDATVTTAAGEGRARVAIGAMGVRLEGTAEGVSEAHLAQLVAIAKTLGRRSDEGWPRRIHRWRAPGVR